MGKEASPEHPIHDLIAARWSPYAYSRRLIPDADLRSIFEAARWAASSFNEQPWRYVVASRDRAEAFRTILTCLLEGNQAWAQEASTLALGCVKTAFSRNNRPNRVAQHDLGLASATLTLEATNRGVYVHQMAGIRPDRAREVCAIPDGYEAVTGLALGYLADPGAGTAALLSRDRSPRTRRPLPEFVFTPTWGEPAL